MKAELTILDTLDTLATEGFNLPDDYKNIISDLNIDKDDASSPWYVRFFVGLCAWIAAILLVAFLFAADVLQTEQSAAFIGILFCAIAIGINRWKPRNDFMGQLGLALSLAGQILFFIGLYDFFREDVILPALGLILLEVILLWVYKSGLHRVISTLVILGAILAIFFDLEIMEAVHILVFALGAGLVTLHTEEYRFLIAGLEDLILPVSYGVAIFLMGLLILPLVADFDLRWWITALVLLPVLLFLVSRIVADLSLDLRRGAVPWLFAGCVVLLVPAIRMPGIIGALIVLLLAFWRNNRILLGLSGVFFVFYLGAYYYSLEWTLLVKSFALAGTGAIMLLLRLILLKFTRGVGS
ncbi:MAG: DUF4401 domain-containing protein [Anaerolineales bacterium]|nr:MAG: DUF4401 domain-containing protein [Anaerolineales bacterium]